MNKQLQKLTGLLGLTCCLIFLGGFTLTLASELPAPVNSTIEEVLSSYNNGDDFDIVKNNTTGRFQASADASSFAQVMIELRRKLGKITSKEELFVVKDVYAKDKLSFYRAAFKVMYEKGEARHYIVLMIDQDGKIKVDGWAIYVKDAFVLARGNLYNLTVEKDGSKNLLSVIPLKVLRDSKTDYLIKKKKEAIEKQREELKPALELAAKGKFQEAKEILIKINEQGKLIILNDLEKKVVKPSVVQKIFKSLLAISENNWADAKKYIESAISADKNYWPIYAVASTVEQKTTNDKAKLALYSTKVAAGMKEMINSSCEKTEPVKGKIVEHCRINLSSPLEWTKINGKLEGELKVFDKEGHVLVKSNYTHNILDGRQEYYYPNGKLSGWKLYDNGVLKKTQKLDQDGKIVFEQEK